ncbi:hypothetical protein N0V91_006106 [Didymella pomorum]|uniref:Uncharacterized protein n=1 Tax=Didymella pomorum TaxID=749634 RepID=A0A9W8ZBQ7_9PLEO|nr:hypothetical protein N0V91_006106 [Didymella pomorum]
MPVGSMAGAEDAVVVTEEDAGREVVVEVAVFAGAAVAVGTALVVEASITEEEGTDDEVADEEVLGVLGVADEEANDVADEEAVGVADRDISELAVEEVELLDEDGSVEKEVPTGAPVAAGAVLLVEYLMK